MTDIGEGVVVTQIPDPESDHWIQVEYTYSSGQPVEGRYTAVDGDGMTWTGQLNDKGQVCLADLPSGNVSVELVSSDDEDELAKLRQEIKAILDAIIKAEREEAARHQAELEEQSRLGKTMSHSGAVLKGLWNGAVGVVEFVWDTATTAAEIVEYLSPVTRLNNLLASAYTSYKDGDFNEAEWRESLLENYKEEEFKDLAELLGFDIRELDAEKIEQIKLLLTEAYEITAFIAQDAESLDMLTQFAVDYAGAQSSLEWAEFAGGGVFEIVLTALLLAFTGGLGNVAQVASKVRHANKLRSLGHQLRRLGKLLKRKKLKKKVSVGVDSKKTVKADLPDKVELKARSDKEQSKSSENKKDNKAEVTDKFSINTNRTSGLTESERALVDASRKENFGLDARVSGSRDKTSGILEFESGNVPLISGKKFPPGTGKPLPAHASTTRPRGSGSGFTSVTADHVEGHAAAIMHDQGIKQARLFIDNPLCNACTQNIETMLPKGSVLQVVDPNGTEIYVGN